MCGFRGHKEEMPKVSLREMLDGRNEVGCSFEHRTEENKVQEVAEEAAKVIVLTDEGQGTDSFDP